MSSIDLDGLAHDVLDACVASLDTIPTDDATLSGAPERSFVHPGVPAWDCPEQLAVWTPAVGEAPTSPPAGATRRRHVFGRIPLVTVMVMVTRCLPEGQVVGTTYRPPSVTEMEAAAAQIHADGWALYNGLFNRIAQGVLSDRCSEVAWDGLNEATPTGGCAGWMATLRFQLDGYGYTDPIGT